MIFDLMEDNSVQIVREATFVVTNIITTVQQDQKLIFNLATSFESRLIRLLANALKIQNHDFLLEILDSLRILFGLEESFQLSDTDKLSYKFEVSGGLDNLESLRLNPSEKIFKGAENLIQNHFNADNDYCLNSEDQPQNQSQMSGINSNGFTAVTRDVNF